MGLHFVTGQITETFPYLVKFIKNGGCYGMNVNAISEKDAKRQVKGIEGEIEIYEVERV